MPPSKRQIEFFGNDVAKNLEKRELFPYGVPDIDFLPTGLYDLDLALGGGVPKRRITEVAGLNQTGKSTLALSIAQHVIETGGRVAWFEAEEALDPYWMIKLGIPQEQVLWDEDDSFEKTHFHIFHPPYLEVGFETVRDIAKSDLYDLIVYDSVGGSPTWAAYQASIEDQQMTQLARVCSRMRAVLPQDIKKGKAAVLFTNTVYEAIKLDFLDPLIPYGGKYIPSGGQGIGFLATIRILMYKPKKIEGKAKGDEKAPMIGREHAGQVWKNKVAGVGRKFSYHLMNTPDFYIDIPQDIMTAGERLGILKKAGSWWSYKGENIAHGEIKMKDLIKTDMSFMLELTAQIEQKIIETRQTKELASEPITEGVIEEADVDSLPESETDPLI